jgi:hypothetical protein
MVFEHLIKTKAMFSLIFFFFVAFILVAGFLVVTGRNKKRRSATGNDLSKTTNPESVHRSVSGFNETRSDDLKGRVVPTQLPLNNLNSEENNGEDKEPGNQHAS